MAQMNLFTINSEHQTFNDICDALGCENNVPAWPDLFGNSIRAYLDSNNIEKIRTLSLTFDGVKNFITNFVNETEYSARAFEIVIHGFMQAMHESHLLGDLDLVPMSQMRSANKKHGNIGDVELREGRVIVEAWDAKYGKPYLRDELEELRDKILTSPGVKVAGFIVDSTVDRRKDIVRRAEEIEAETGVSILLLSFSEWLEYQTKRISKTQLDEIGKRWLIAVVESFAQRRLEIAPIDEPCEAWVQDLIARLK